MDEPPVIASLPVDTKRPFWSVMIPTFNPRREHLEAALKGVVGENIGRDEMQIEVIDDCSPNEWPEEWLGAFSDRVSFYKMERNLGLAGIWNECIERAEGHWVHILHQDDLVYPGFYNSLRRGIQKNPDVGAAFCRHAYCDETGEWQKVSVLEKAEPGVLRNFVEPLVTGYHIQCAAIVVKRETYGQLGGFDARLRHALDWEMWIRIANSYSFFYEPKVLAAWRNHADATTSQQMRSGENIRDITRAIVIWSRHLAPAAGRRYRRMARKRVADEAIFGAKMFADRGDVSPCLAQISAALRCHCSAGVLTRATKIILKLIARLMSGKLRTRRDTESVPTASTEGAVGK